MSPDGRLVAYVVESLNGEKDAYQTDVWLVPVAGGEARALASSPVGDDAPRWSPDGRFVAFLSERPRPGAKADDDAKRQVWLIRPDGGEAVPLTDAPASVSAFGWAPDGKTVAFLAREPRSDERKRRDKEKDDAWTPSEKYAWNRLWTIDVATGQARQLTSGELHVTGMSVSPDGTTIAFAGQPTPRIPDGFRSDLYTIPATGGTPAPLVARKGADDCARLVARRQVDRLRLAGRPGRGVVHEQLRQRRPGRGRRAALAHRVPRRADRRARRLGPHVDARQRGRALLRRLAHGRTRLPGDARRQGRGR